MAQEAKRVDLLFSELDFGTYEWGFIKRDGCRDEDEEDTRYQRHMKEKHGIDVKCANGYMYLPELP